MSLQLFEPRVIGFPRMQGDGGSITIMVGNVMSQIREQMCLETHFQYEFSFLGSFGAFGAAERIFLNTLAFALKSYII